MPLLNRFRYVIFGMFVFLVMGCGPLQLPSEGQTLVPGEAWSGFRIIARYPHDPNAFTQGFLYYDGFFYESTGLYGQSSLRRVEAETGIVVQQHNLEPQYFGEGLTRFDDRLYQLTWREGRCFVYDLHTFEQLQVFVYAGEGWGLTNDGTYLIGSDGSAFLTFFDPETFLPRRRIEVRSSDGPVNYLNELEYINGEIWANIWLTDFIVRVDPADGTVLGWLDLSGLLSDEDRQGRAVDVLNGIAYDPREQRLFVTGKLWPWVYEIALEARLPR